MLALLVACLVGAGILFLFFKRLKGGDTSTLPGFKRLAAPTIPRELLASLPRVKPQGSTVDVPVLYINLDRSEARRGRLESHFRSLDVPSYERVPAVDGVALGARRFTLQGESWAAGLPTDPAELAQLMGCDSELRTLPELGCTLSHIKAIMRARELGRGTVLVVEDDIDLGAEALWPHSLRDIEREAPAGWCVVSLYDGRVPLAHANRASFYELDPYNCYGTVAYLVSTEGQDAVAKALEPPHETLLRSAKTNGCAADRLLYTLLGRCYGYSYPMASTLNNKEELQSTIHENHTDYHVGRALAIFQVQLRSREPARCIWCCWPGDNPMPDYLQLCLETWRLHNEPLLEVRLLTPETIPKYLPSLHPAYQSLSYVHRSDYLRAAILHLHGGFYVDIDSVCLAPARTSFRLLHDHDFVGYTGKEHEHWGVTAMFARPTTPFTSAWLSRVEAVLSQKHQELASFRANNPSLKKDCLRWSEVLGELMQPLAQDVKEDASIKWTLASGDWHVLDERDLLQNDPARDPLKELEGQPVLLLNNALYPDRVRAATYEEISQSPLSLFRILSAAHARASIAAAARAKAACFGVAYYINLDARTDRRKAVESELRRAFPDTPAERIEAVKDSAEPSRGCLQSHCVALRKALVERPGQNILVCEDDVEFTPDARATLDEALRTANIEPQWDVLMLAAHIRSVGEGPGLHSDKLRLVRVGTAQTTACYLVRSDYVEKLLLLWEATAREAGDRWHPEEHACDKVWFSLQKLDYWYAFRRCSVARQRAGYSDIEHKHTDYAEDCAL
jgi:GR25 family glycosyltransferase involved in LPS biosynthesis